MRSRSEGDIERRQDRRDRPTSGAINNCNRTARRSTSALVGCAARRTIAPRDLIDRNRRSRRSSTRCDRPTSDAIDDR